MERNKGKAKDKDKVKDEEELPQQSTGRLASLYGNGRWRPKQLSPVQERMRKLRGLYPPTATTSQDQVAVELRKTLEGKK